MGQYLQNEDMIELELSDKNLIRIDLPGNWEDAAMLIQKLKFFHTWVFYYYYSADHKFINHIIKYKFTFSKTLFKEVLDVIYDKKHPNFQKNIQYIYCQWKNQKFEESYKKRHMRSDNLFAKEEFLKIFPFIVPIVEDNAGKLEVNWTLINLVIKRIKQKIMSIISCEHPSFSIERRLDLQEKYPEEGFMSHMKDVWDDKFTGVRYVKLKEYWSADRWHQPVLHLENR